MILRRLKEGRLEDGFSLGGPGFFSPGSNGPLSVALASQPGWTQRCRRSAALSWARLHSRPGGVGTAGWGIDMDMIWIYHGYR